MDTGATPPNEARKPAVFSWLFIPVSLIVPPAGLILAFRLWATSKKSVKNILLGFLILVIAVIGTVGYLRLYAKYVNSRSNYTYQKTEAERVAVTNISGLTFQKPVEFKKNYNSQEQKTTTTTFSHTTEKGYAISNLGVAATKAGNQDTKFVDGINYLLDANNGPVYSKADYDSYTSHFLDFVKSFNSSEYSIQLSLPKKFTNPNIKSNAWVFDVSGETKPSVNLAPIQGQFIFILGKNGYYYFALTTIKTNWRSNSSTWQQVFNSIKIDQ